MEWDDILEILFYAGVWLFFICVGILILAVDIATGGALYLGYYKLCHMSEDWEFLLWLMIVPVTLMYFIMNIFGICYSLYWISDNTHLFGF